MPAFASCCKRHGHIRNYAELGAGTSQRFPNVCREPGSAWLSNITRAAAEGGRGLLSLDDCARRQ